MQIRSVYYDKDFAVYEIDLVAQKGNQAEFQKRYGKILKTAGIDIDVNVNEASQMSFKEWKAAVQTNGKWDYKNNQVLHGYIFNAKIVIYRIEK